MNTFLTFLIPIIIVYLLLSIWMDLRDFTKTTLGKFFAILIIIYYTTIDKKLGALACLLIILYYHSTLAKMLNIKQGVLEEYFGNKEETLDDPMVDLGLDDAMGDYETDDDTDDDTDNETDDEMDIIDIDDETVDIGAFDTLDDLTVGETPIRNRASDSMQESFSNYNNVYEPDKTFDETIKYDKNKNYMDEFRQKNCKNETLLYKDMIVKDDMIEHIYSDIDFPNEKCNPCSKRCNFSIIESKLKQEAKLFPIHSKN